MDSALASAIPYWDVQLDVPIRKEHFYYNPLNDLERDVLGNQNITHYDSEGEIANYLLYSARLPAGAKVQASPHRDYALDLTDVPAIVHENDAPPERSRVYSVHFYYTPFLTGNDFWAAEGKRWSKNAASSCETSGSSRSNSEPPGRPATREKDYNRRSHG